MKTQGGGKVGGMIGGCEKFCNFVGPRVFAREDVKSIIFLKDDKQALTKDKQL